MTILTERDKAILLYLKRGTSVKDIAEILNTQPASISRSISVIRYKAQDIKEDFEFLQDIGYMDVYDGRISFIHPRTPRA